MSSDRHCAAKDAGFVPCPSPASHLIRFAATPAAMHPYCTRHARLVLATYKAAEERDPKLLRQFWDHGIGREPSWA